MPVYFIDKLQLPARLGDVTICRVFLDGVVVSGSFACSLTLRTVFYVCTVAALIDVTVVAVLVNLKCNLIAVESAQGNHGEIRSSKGQTKLQNKINDVVITFDL